MSAIKIQEIILNFIQIMILVPIIYGSGKMMNRGRNGLIPVLFTFGMFSFLLSDLYYLIYDLLRPDTRMPFAANEIAECALILLLTAMLETALVSCPRRKWEMLFSVLFIEINVALWIAWSGEWFEDIVFGLPYVYYMCLVLRGIRCSQAMRRIEVLVSFFLVSGNCILQVVSVLIGGSTAAVLDIVSIGVMYAQALLFLIVTVRAFRRPDTTGKALYATNALHLWSLIVLFSSAGVFYNISQLINILVAPLMYLAVKREVAALQEKGGAAV